MQERTQTIRSEPMIETLEERIKKQDNLIRHLDNRMEKYVRNNDAIREMLRRYDCNELDAVLLVSWLRMYV